MFAFIRLRQAKFVCFACLKRKYELANTCQYMSKTKTVSDLVRQKFLALTFTQSNKAWCIGHYYIQSLTWRVKSFVPCLCLLTCTHKQLWHSWWGRGGSADWWSQPLRLCLFGSRKHMLCSLLTPSFICFQVIWPSRSHLSPHIYQNWSSFWTVL